MLFCRWINDNIGKSFSHIYVYVVFFSPSTLQALIVPLEEVLESKHEDEVEVLQVVLSQVSQMKKELSASSPTRQALDEHLRQLEQKLQHEIDVAKQRHKTHLEVFKQVGGGHWETSLA